MQPKNIGELAEWSMAAVLKTVELKGSGGSNPSLSAKKRLIFQTLFDFSLYLHTMKAREHFGGRAAVIMALAGSAIGLGNIWRFPYVVGQNGGAAFVFVYILATIFLSLPIFFAESVIGRRSRANCRGALATLAPGTKWHLFGLLSVITPLLIVSYYSVVGGWSLDYLYKAATLSFTGGSGIAGGSFGSFVSSTWEPLIAHTLFLLICIGIIFGGVRKGIGKVSKIGMPILFLLIVVIVIYAVSLPGAGKGVDYLLHPDFSKITGKTVLDAIGQSFYSLSLGMGIIITYSSYVQKEENLLVTGFGTATADLLFAMLAGMAIMPAVFAAGIAPESGPGLIFDTLPYIFSSMAQQMPVLTAIVAILFFLTVLFAAVTSAVSLLEVGVAYLSEEFKMSRIKAGILVFLFAWVLGVICSLSFGPLADIQIFGLGIFDILDKFCSNILLIIGGLLCVIFVGWKMKRADVYDEFTNGGAKKFNGKIFSSIYFVIRYLAPVAVLMVFLSSVL